MPGPDYWGIRNITFLIAYRHKDKDKRIICPQVSFWLGSGWFDCDNLAFNWLRLLFVRTHVCIFVNAKAYI